MFFVMSLSLSDHKVLYNIASSSSFFSSALVFRTSNFGSLRYLMIYMRLVIADSALRASLAIRELTRRRRQRERHLKM